MVVVGDGFTVVVIVGVGVTVTTVVDIPPPGKVNVIQVVVPASVPLFVFGEINTTTSQLEDSGRTYSEELRYSSDQGDRG